jgi:hypothetical protein
MRTFIFTALGCSLSACATVDIPSRNVPFEALVPDLQLHSIMPAIAIGSDYGGLQEELMGTALTINKVNVRLPRTLLAAEANRDLPQADILWREATPGDRHAQVQAIVQTAFEAGVRRLQGPVAAELDVEVLRFHALSKTARDASGAEQSIAFTMVLRDAETGEALTPVREVTADLTDLGRGHALVTMAEGLTQKERITGFLAKVIQQEILTPGHRSKQRGELMTALNRL